VRTAEGPSPRGKGGGGLLFITRDPSGIRSKGERGSCKRMGRHQPKQKKPCSVKSERVSVLGAEDSSLLIWREGSALVWLLLKSNTGGREGGFLPNKAEWALLQT